MKTKAQSSSPTDNNGNSNLHTVKEKGIIKAKTSLETKKRDGIQVTEDSDVDLVQKTIDMRKKLIGAATQIHFPESPLYISRGSGQYLYDEKDVQYLDLMNNVAHVGHCHPHVVKASRDQNELLNTNSRYLHDKIITCAKMLTDLLPERLSVCYFVNSGTEANDLAMRLAKTYTKHKDVLVLDHAYHGTSICAMDMSPYKFNQPGAEGQQDYVHVAPHPDPYRGRYCGDVDDPAIGEAYANDAIKVMNAAVIKGRQIGMFIAESMMSCGGQLLLPKGYLKKVYEHVHKLGGVCAADEVQVGFGRAGKHGYWGFEMQDVVPDIVTIGKPFGNGHPVSCVVTTEEISAAFTDTKVAFFNTFGGNPVSMAIAIAVMEVIEKEKLQDHAEDVGEFLKTLLIDLKTKHPLIGDVRGCGLFIGIDLVSDRITKTPATEDAKILTMRLRHRGILISRDGPHANILKVKPPMVITHNDMKHFAEQLDLALTEMEEEKKARTVN